MIPCSSSRTGLNKQRLGRTGRYRNNPIDARWPATYLTISLFLSIGFVSAQEEQTEIKLDEDFLFYLADMSIEDGDIIDQLDMLNLESDGIEINIEEQPTTPHEKSIKVKYENFGSDEKEEQQ